MTSDHTNGRLRQWMVAAVGCAVQPCSALYVSTPITTGARFVAWRRGRGAGLDPASDDYRRERLAAVIEPNRRAAAVVVADLRRRLGHPVVDPTSLEDVPGWQQLDYHRLWVEVVERFATAVLFTDGWEYSSGCVLELAAAVRSGLQLHVVDGSPLTRAEARQEVVAAIEDVGRDGVLPTAPLEMALEAFARQPAALVEPAPALPVR